MGGKEGIQNGKEKTNKEEKLKRRKDEEEDEEICR